MSSLHLHIICVINSYIHPILVLPRLKACDIVISGGKTVNLSSMRFVNIGLPRSGKTTFWRRLEKEILNIVRAREEGEKEEPSTGVACQRGQVLIRGAKSATGIISAGDWSLLDHDKEIEMLLQFIADIANGLSTDISWDDVADESSEYKLPYNIRKLSFDIDNGLPRDISRDYVADKFSSKHESSVFYDKYPFEMQPEHERRKRFERKRKIINCEHERERRERRERRDRRERRERRDRRERLERERRERLERDRLERERLEHERLEHERHERDFAALQERDIYSIINKAMQSDQWDKVKYELEKITLLISTDTGGHAEFLDMYAALVSGPSFNLLFSSLKDDLDSTFKVYFTDENSESTEEYSSDLTVEEVLFPALSSIACFSDSFCATDSTSSSIPPADAKVQNVREALMSCQSKVMFVGTHKDEVSEEEFREKDRVLLERIENTEFYKKGLIEHFDGSQLMLPVDNMYGDEDEMDKIRKRLMEVVSSFKKIPIPASWLMLNLIIRGKKCSTMSLEDCEEIAGNLKISKEELQHALWFLHHSVGSLLYYPEVEELKDTVICKVEAMYDSVTNFIAKIYKCKAKNWQAYQKFRKEGQLSLKQVEEATSGAPIPQHKLFKLMQHLNMITMASPSLSDSSTKDPTYFMPCILNSARSTALSVPVAIDGKPPPLMLRYKCGYTPVGVFPAMITNLVSRHLELGWNMIKPSTGLLKNKVEFRVGHDRSKVFLISHFHCFEIAISRSSSVECHSQTTESLCSCVRKVITDTLEVVTSRMNYNFSMEYQYGFECPTHPGKKHLCVLHTNASTCMECIQVPELSPIPLKHHHKMWFSSGMSI